MSRLAWLYRSLIFCIAAALAGMALVSPEPAQARWSAFVQLTLLATLSQWYTAVAPPNDHQSYSTMMTFFFAGVLVLTPLQFVLLVVLAHTVEWYADKMMRAGNLAAWQVRPFNIETHIIAGMAAFSTLKWLGGTQESLATLPGSSAIGVALLVYLLLNHYLLGQALVLMRKVSWKQTGLMAPDNLLTALSLLSFGYVMAILWTLNAWLVAAVLPPLVLVHRALQIPKLREQAVTDGKTGLLNATHFSKVFTHELARAKRFERPLAVIIADLDLLRNVNNTFGHLAGDAVLAGVGQIIRKTIRDYDIAGRFGGEEFSIALPETSPAHARDIAERLRKAVAETPFMVRTSATPIQVTMSLGVASRSADTIEANQLIHQADLAVYQAKVHGRNRVVAASDLPHSVKLEGIGIPD